MRPRNVLVGTIGVLATIIGLGLLFTPALFHSVGPIDQTVSTVEVLDTATIGVIAGGLVVVALLITARSPAAARGGLQSSANPRFEQAATTPSEAVTSHTQTITAETVDSTIHEAVSAGDEALDEIRRLLSDTATSVYAERADIPESEATAVVDRGDWTDDAVASVFLAGPKGPRPPLKMRLRLWLAPERERTRRIERTVAAIERVSRR